MPDIKKVEVELNFGILKLKGVIAPNEQVKNAAWELYVELVTRITTVELEDNLGILRESLNSIYTLFGSTRQIMRKYGPAIAVHNSKYSLSISLVHLALSILNYV